MSAVTTDPDAAPASIRWEAGELVISRRFDAPRELVFRAWTEAEQFARWFGPHGSTLPVCTVEARPGGTLHFCHRLDDGTDVWVRGTYTEVDAPERIAFTCHFSDPAGGRMERAGFPAEMRITVTIAEREGGTEMTVRQSGLKRDQGEVQGWIEAMDRLRDLLPRA